MREKLKGFLFFNACILRYYLSKTLTSFNKNAVFPGLKMWDTFASDIAVIAFIDRTRTLYRIYCRITPQPPNNVGNSEDNACHLPSKSAIASFFTHFIISIAVLENRKEPPFPR
jgi:hypothetical protein